MKELYNQSWEVFNAAFHEGGLIQESMREQGKALLSEAQRQEHTERKAELYPKLDEQNALIDAALRMKAVRAELAGIGGQK